MTRAVVLGGGFAGVLAAVAVRAHVDEVLVLDSDRLPARPEPRRGLPQGDHSHLLVTGGAQALDRLLPGAIAELIARGARRRGLPDEARIMSADGWFEAHVTGSFLICATRWLLDHVVRERAMAAGVPAVRGGTRVVGLTGSADCVSGVVVRGASGRREQIRADLVIDATGRRSQAHRWLAELGAGPVREVRVDAELAYCTRHYRPPASEHDIPATMIHPTRLPAYGGTLFPVEDGRWIATLTCGPGTRVPADETEFLSLLAGLASPTIADQLSRARPLSAIQPFAGTVNRRRYYECLPSIAGFLVLGDSLVAVNPVFSHGMSVAALSAVHLADELGRNGVGALAEVQRGIAEIADRSWRMATSPVQLGGAVPRPAPGASRGRSVVSDRLLMTAFFGRQTFATAAARVPA